MNLPATFKLSPIALSLLLISNSALSADDTEVIEVTGHQVHTGDLTITADDLDKRQAQDLNDIFRGDAEVSVGGSSGISQKIYVRGLEDTMLNISVDGAEQSGSLFHHQGRLSIEPELLKQVDVSAGAGRATNGPGALGGAIQFKTKDAHDLLHPNDSFGAQVKGGYYTNNDGYKVSTSLYGEVTEGLGLLASFGYVDGQNIKDGNGDSQPYTALEQTVALLKLSGQITESQYFSLSYDFRQDDGRRLNRPHFQPSFKNDPLDQEADRHTITASHKYMGSDRLNVESTLYNTSNRIAHKNHPRWGTSDGSIETYGAKISNTSNWTKNTVIYGVDYRNDTADFDTGSGAQNSKEKGEVYGLFVQDDWRITQDLTFTAGARYDWYELEDNKDQKFDSSGFSPNAGLDYKITPSINVFASYAEAFRGQQIKELFVIDYKENDPNRKPEKAQNTEFGMAYQAQDLAIGATFFYSEIEDVVGDNGTITNVGDLKNKGINAYISYQFDQLRTRLSYSQSRPELNGEPLSDDSMNIGTSVGDTWVLDLGYTVTDNVELGWNARFVERLTDVADPSAHPEKPGYGVHDLYAQWIPMSNDKLTFTLSVKNVFDKFYFDHASYMEYIGSPVAQGYASAGRDFRFNASYSF
ncbi:TonB-dependent receptor domain-containing protein [Vibrio pelagius]|uniref:TonB-dependent receptor domain-containing protein n=1 Tax=Vibrio pelagius TaxID=28169 RepID=UPI00355276A2